MIAQISPNELNQAGISKNGEEDQKKPKKPKRPQEPKKKITTDDPKTPAQHRLNITYTIQQ